MTKDIELLGLLTCNDEDNQQLSLVLTTEFDWKYKKSSETIPNGSTLQV